RTEERLDFARDLSTLEVGAGEGLLFVARQEIEPLECVAGTIDGWEVAEDRVARCFGAQQHAAPLRTEPITLIEHDAGRCTAAIHIAGRNDARIFLAPLRGRNGLAWASIRCPVALTVAREESEIAVLHQERRATRGRVVVVVLENIAEARHGLFVAV